MDDSCPLRALRETFRTLDAQLVEQMAALLAKVSACEAHERDLENRRLALEEQQAELDIRERDVRHREEKLRPLQEGLADVIKLNIAGELHCSVRRSTLCQVSDSMLAAQFGGRWDEGQKDSEGAFFINFPSEVFLPLLDFLRAEEIAAAHPKSPAGSLSPIEYVLPDERILPDFLRMVVYFGLSPSLFFPFQMRVCGATSDSSGVKLNKQSFRVDTTKFVTVVLDSSVGFPSYEVLVEGIERPQVGWATTQFAPNSERGKGVGDDFESWGLNGKFGKFWHGGKMTALPQQSCRWQDGDTVRCTLDQEARLMRWFINGVEAVECQRKLPATTLLPAVTGKGNWAFKLGKHLLGGAIAVHE